MLDLIVKILLIILVIMQIAVMAYIFYTNKKTLENDKNFYKRLNEEIEKSSEQFQIFLDEHKKEDTEDEQTRDQK